MGSPDSSKKFHLVHELGVKLIDKAFRIAKPMRKASWTKRFAAGWGERRCTNDDVGSGEGD